MSEERNSKTARKREAKRLAELAERLTKLPDETLSRLPLDDELIQALADHGRQSGNEGRRRHLRFLARLVRQSDVDALERVLGAHDADQAATSFQHHQLERWRDELIASDAALTRYVDGHPGTDVAILRNLIREARRTPQRPARALFRFLRDNEARREP